jgi:hypothetical protein
MNQPSAADSAIREKISAYIDPYLGQTLGEAKAVGTVASANGRLTVELVLGFPCADYGPELQAALEAHLKPLIGDARLDLKLRAQITAHAVQRPPAKEASGNRPPRRIWRSPGRYRGQRWGCWTPIYTAPANRS